MNYDAWIMPLVWTINILFWAGLLIWPFKDNK